jgi:hypothetical protein
MADVEKVVKEGLFCTECQFKDECNLQCIRIKDGTGKEE